MNWRNTWLLVGVAAALFAFIFLYERHISPSGAPAVPQPILPGFRASSATGIQLRKGTAFIVNLQRTNGTWRYLNPSYPAAGLAVQSFLDLLEQVIPAVYITPQEMVARKQTEADFGFDAPAIHISLECGNERYELQFGARTPGNDQVYARVRKPGLYVVNAAILDRLPHSPSEWRDRSLLALPSDKVDRLDITRPGGGGFTLQRDTTNKLWRMTRPIHRADQVKVDLLLQKLTEARIATFVTDDSRADLEPFGLQAPELELTVDATIDSQRSNQKIQFGHSPTNDATQVYARLANTTNVILVARSLLELLAIPYVQFRDPHLVSFTPEAIDAIEIKGDESFTIKRQPNGAWTFAETPVDSQFVNEQLNQLSQLQVNDPPRGFVKDVVLDFSPYGLSQPRLQLGLISTITNGTAITNAVVTRLDFGSNQNQQVYVRRGDETSVYLVHLLDFVHLPGASWQLRDHQVWNFTTNNVVHVTVHRGNRTAQWLRQTNGSWASTSGVVNEIALEETMYRLGQLRATAWVARGASALDQFEINSPNFEISIDLKEGDKARTVSLPIRVSSRAPLPLPYAATTIEGEPWVFEFPWAIFGELQRNLPVDAGGGGR